jgi:hypothetical protein
MKLIPLFEKFIEESIYEKRKKLKNNLPITVYRGTHSSGKNFYKGNEKLPFTYYALNKEKAMEYGVVKSFIFNKDGKKVKIFYGHNLFDKFGLTTIDDSTVIKTLILEGYDAILYKGNELIVLNSDLIENI